ncbi:hypothetical protein HH214_13290 [Mucilaginibacter robiniae]|uniref:Uncharacterized protein n=1 Tax=Mucilaginibacter robiniae TaxID=2728022 RepID=A0A7L5E158_9SPHI|nr:hypothetical protein [Mucilaginibacter robiniae]QJD96771.1 hypothetical protein HH214_13290 [Mucilaginibacter robiniae]
MNDAVKNSTIHDPQTKLKVTVCDMLKSKFKPRKGEVRYFVTAGQETLAFETQGYKRHRKLLILHMVAWYCMYLGLMEAQIHSSLPLNFK